ncbi:MAG: L,D-transpeptidase [Candidatus Absconditicoccaceae bacterium]
MAGEVFDQQYGLNKQEEKDFLKQGDIDKIKTEVGGDIQKLEDIIIKNYHSENYDNVSQVRIDQIKNTVGNDFYTQNHKLKPGGAEGIAALQILAMKCVNVMNINGNTKIVEDMLKNEYINSWPVDGILGPNTLFVLKEISKTDLGGEAMPDWNGVIGEDLLNKMLNICGEEPIVPEEEPIVPEEEPIVPEEEPIVPEEEPIVPEEEPIVPEEEPIVPEEEPIVPEEEPIVPDIVQLKSSLKNSFAILALKYSVDGYVFDKKQKISNDGEREYYSITKDGNVLMDIGIFVVGSDKGKSYVGLEDYIYEKSDKGGEIDFSSFDDKTEFENIINEIHVGKNGFQKPIVPEEEPIVPEEEPIVPEEEPIVPEEKPIVPEEEPIVPDEEPIVPEEEPKEEKLNLEGFSTDNKNLQIALKGKLAGVKFETLITNVLSISNGDVRKIIEEYLLKGDVKGMQEDYLGMKEGSLYSDNRADGVLGKFTMNRMLNPLFGLKGKDIENNYNIALDVKSKYKEFLDNNLNKNLSFAIVSKSDFNMYIFSADHRLIGIHSILLGKDRGDQKNTAYGREEIADGALRTTPGGMYYIPENAQKPGNKANIFSKEYAGPGEYVALYPEENQYDVNNANGYTLGFHNYYLGKNRKGERASLFSLGKDQRRVSGGCINTLSQGAIYDNLVLKSKIYITKE